MSRVFGSVHVPEHLEIIEMVTGITELVPRSKVGRNNYDTMKSRSKREAKQSSDPYGVIYPGILRIMYDIPSEFPVHPSSSFGVAEYQDDSSYNYNDLATFNQFMNENVTVFQNVGPFVPDSPDGESTLDVQVRRNSANSNCFTMRNSLGLRFVKRIFAHFKPGKERNLWIELFNVQIAIFVLFFRVACTY